MSTRIDETPGTDLAVAATPNDQVEDRLSFLTPVDFEYAPPGCPVHSHELYKALREHGPVARVRFQMAEPPTAEAQTTHEAAPPSADATTSHPRENALEDMLDRPLFIFTTYEEGSAALLDNRFSVDPRRLMTPEQRAEMDRAAGEELQPLSRSLLGLDPPDHTRIRRLVQPSFSPKQMTALRPRVQVLTDRLLDAAERAASERGETAPDRGMDLLRSFAYPLPVAVISELLGIPPEDHAEAERWVRYLLSAERQNQAVADEVREGLREFIEYLRALFVRKRANPADDLISEIVLTEMDGDRLSEDEALATVFLIYIAGFITTVNLIDNAVVALLTHPGQLAKFKADPALAGNVIEETLRYWGPAEGIIPRLAVEDVEIAGTTIPKGDRMMVNLASADRDPARFANPDVFDISRTDANRHVAFGKGIHVCLGAPLARLEGQIAIETLFRRYPELRLAVPAGELTWAANFLRGFSSVPVLF